MSITDKILLTETPRDALQGWSPHIPAERKAEYINLLLKCGFETVDTGSFVSPKAVPQMADTEEVISLLDTAGSFSRLMVLAGNMQGGNRAAELSRVNIISYPYSVSETFLKRNLNTTPELARQTVMDLKSICQKAQKQLRVYVSMAFGNPYGDKWNDEIVLKEVDELYSKGIHNLVFSDITGVGTPTGIEQLCSVLIKSFPKAELGIHLHTKSNDWQDKVEAAWRGGMRNFESAVGGFGGCPMTGFELLGNLDTLNLVEWCERNGIETGVDTDILFEASEKARQIFK